MQASNTRAAIDALVSSSIAWATGIAQAERIRSEGDQPRVEGSGGGTDVSDVSRSKIVVTQADFCMLSIGKNEAVQT